MTDLMLSPYRTMSSLRDAMDRLLDASFVFPKNGQPANGSPRLGVAVDIVGAPDEYVLYANVPGFKAEDLHIEVVENTVTFWGEIKPQSEAGQQPPYIWQERPFGQFRRTLTLPSPLDPNQAEATVENGVLTLRLPKAETARPKAITVKAKR